MGWGQGTIYVDDPDKVYNLQNFEFYIDSSNALSINVIEHSPFRKKTKENRSEIFNTYNTWIKVDLNVDRDQIHELVFLMDQANMDSIDFYQRDVDGSWRILNYGNDYPFGHRKYKVNHFMFDVNTDNQHTVFYVRIRNKVKTTYNIIVGEHNTILEYESNALVIFSVLLGIIFAMVAYNLFLYVSLKERMYLIYVILSFLTGILQMVLFGVSFQYLWPSNIFLQNIGSELLTTIATMGGLIFMNAFLKTSEHAPRLYIVSKVFIVFYLLLVLLVWFDVPLVNTLLLTFQPIIALYILSVAIIVMMGGYKPAKYYLIAWSTFLLGILVFVMAEVGVIERNNITTLTITFGAGLEVVLLSFALANRINILKGEQEEAVGMSLRLEKEKATLIFEQNLILEKKVNVRTKELNETNQVLEEKNHEVEKAYSELKSTQSQLVNAEKMSSLGQLTAGIAHEINNPINFVSSNVGPLKRDVDDIVSIFEATERLAKESMSAETYQEILDLKEEIEYDYVKEEIDHLLHGMKDGANRTVEIVKGLKLFSRVDEDDLKMVNLEDGIKSTLVLLNSNIKHVLNVVTHYGNIPNIECYGGKMNQVFMNILNNAIQAIKSDVKDVEGEIIVSTSSDEKNVYISISDNGPGMTEEVQNKLFEPFFTTKPVGEGTGLGLSIVYKIIEKIDGTINVNSKINEGTEFIITLPRTNTTKPPSYD
jgi:signal transduction histidine kinase